MTSWQRLKLVAGLALFGCFFMAFGIYQMRRGWFNFGVKHDPHPVLVTATDAPFKFWVVTSSFVLIGALLWLPPALLILRGPTISPFTPSKSLSTFGWLLVGVVLTIILLFTADALWLLSR